MVKGEDPTTEVRGDPGRGLESQSSASLGERVGALATGEEVFVILRAVVTDVAHGVKAAVMTRQHKAVAVLLERGQGGRLLEEALVLADEGFGIRDLFHVDDPGEAT